MAGKKQKPQEVDTSRVEKRERAGVERTRDETFVTPRTDIYETDSEIVLATDVPGVPAGGAELAFHDGVLEITAHRRAPEVEKEPAYREYEPASYYRAWSLSEEIDSGKIGATLADGVLRVNLPKSARARPRRIEVKAS